MFVGIGLEVTNVGIGGTANGNMGLPGLPAGASKTLSLPMDGTFAGTHSRLSNAWNPETGQVAPHNLALWSEDFSNAAWLFASPSGSATPDLITFTGAGNDFRYQQAGGAVPVGTLVKFSIELKAGSKTSVRLAIEDVGSVGLTAALTSEYQLFSITYTTTISNSPRIGLDNRVTQSGDGIAGTVYARKARLERYTTSTMTTSYVPTTSTAVYSPRYVSGKTGQAMLIEEASSNYFVNSQGTAAVTQNISVTTANSGKWTCSVFGAGTVTSSAGTATATGYGAATPGTPNTITVTGNGTVTYTVTGATAATIVNVENLPYATSPIVSGATVPVTRAADVVTYPTAGVLTGTVGTVSLWFKPYQSNKSAMPLIGVNGGGQILAYFAGNLNTLYAEDGTTTRVLYTSVGGVAGEWMHVIIAYDGTSIRTSINGRTPIATVWDGDWNTTTTFGIAQFQNGTTQANAAVDNVNVWSVKLTDAQMLQAYRSQK